MVADLAAEGNLVTNVLWLISCLLELARQQMLSCLQCGLCVTCSGVQVEARVGGTFEIFGGAVIGTFTQLQEPTLIGLDWRFRNWEDSAVSKVCMVLPAGGSACNHTH